MSQWKMAVNLFPLIYYIRQASNESTTECQGKNIKVTVFTEDLDFIAD